MKFRFVENRKLIFIVEAALVAFALCMIAIRGFNVGIDFKGGTVANFELHKTFTTDEVKEIVDEYDKAASITTAGDDQTVVVISSSKDFSEAEKVEMFNKFKEKFGLSDNDMLSFTKISAVIGKDLQRQALLASAVAIVCMLVYISIRFKFWYAIASVLCLLHDVIIVLGVYALFQIPVNSSFIAAILTILGYSINNTIVIFDRIRENLKKYFPSLEKLVNDSINATMFRSINTTLTTIVAVLALYIFGVDSIREFTLPMIIGFLAGFVSSLFLASNLWYVFDRKRNLPVTRVS